MNNVIYVLTTIENILSMGGIANKGCIVIFCSKNCWIMSTKKPFEVLGTRIRYELNDLYKFEIVQTNTMNLLNLLINNELMKTPQQDCGVDV
jgi:hypothetical protein